MSRVLKRRCCNSAAIVLAISWGVLVASKAIDYFSVQGSVAAVPSAPTTVAIGTFYP